MIKLFFILLLSFMSLPSQEPIKIEQSMGESFQFIWIHPRCWKIDEKERIFETLYTKEQCKDMEGKKIIFHEYKNPDTMVKK